MTEFQVTSWRDIPSMVASRDGDEIVKIPLHQRCQEAIDEAAMRLGMSMPTPISPDGCGEWTAREALESRLVRARPRSILGRRAIGVSRLAGFLVKSTAGNSPRNRGRVRARSGTASGCSHTRLLEHDDDDQDRGHRNRRERAAALVRAERRTDTSEREGDAHDQG